MFALEAPCEPCSWLTTSVKPSIDHATAACRPPSSPWSVLYYCVIVISDVENHEALRSDQLPNVVWAHDGSDVSDKRRVVCLEKRESARTLAYEVMADFDAVTIQRASFRRRFAISSMVIFVVATIIRGEEGEAIIPRLIRAYSRTGLQKLSQA